MAVRFCDVLPGRRALSVLVWALAWAVPAFPQTAGPSFGTVVSLGPRRQTSCSMSFAGACTW